MIQFNIVDWAARRGVWWRLATFMGVLLVMWSPLALFLAALGHYWQPAADFADIGMLVGLYGLFVLWLRRWGKAVYGWSLPLRQYGLTGGPPFWLNAIATLGLGCAAVFGLFALESLMGWVTWGMPDPEFERIFLEGLLMASLVGFAEELLFRGWLLSELEHDYGSTRAMLICSFIFACAHFIRPWDAIIRTFPQFIGLFILGMALVFARRTPHHFCSQVKKPSVLENGLTDLALPMGLHAGLIWGYYLVRIGDLAQETGRVPIWVTGIEENPLAGLVGLGVLGAIALYFARQAQPKAFGSAKLF
jgi:uncharacterized protein